MRHSSLRYNIKNNHIKFEEKKSNELSKFKKITAKNKNVCTLCYLFFVKFPIINNINETIQ